MFIYTKCAEQHAYPDVEKISMMGGVVECSLLIIAGAEV